MFTRVLVPLDGSRFSEQALAYAIGLATRANATVHLVRVHGVTRPPHAEVPWQLDSATEAKLRGEEEGYLRLLAALPRAGGVRITTAVLSGLVVDAIAAYVEREGIDLVVMTTHGRGGLSRIWLGSVADELIRSVDIPILLLRPGVVERDYGPGFELRQVLIPVDGSEQSERMIEHAIELGLLAGASLSLVRIAVPPSAPSHAGAAAKLAAARTAAVDDVNQLADRIRARGIDVQATVMIESDIPRGIVQHAFDCRAQLIAMTTHARTGLPRILVGSVAERVLRETHLPLLMLPPVRERSRLEAAGSSNEPSFWS